MYQLSYNAYKFQSIAMYKYTIVHALIMYIDLKGMHAVATHYHKFWYTSVTNVTYHDQLL